MRRGSLAGDGWEGLADGGRGQWLCMTKCGGPCDSCANREASPAFECDDGSCVNIMQRKDGKDGTPCRLLEGGKLSSGNIDCPDGSDEDIGEWMRLSGPGLREVGVECAATTSSSVTRWAGSGWGSASSETSWATASPTASTAPTSPTTSRVPLPPSGPHTESPGAVYSQIERFKDRINPFADIGYQSTYSSKQYSLPDAPFLDHLPRGCAEKRCASLVAGAGGAVSAEEVRYECAVQFDEGPVCIPRLWVRDNEADCPLADDESEG